jgi:prevent-host-death family protein
MVPRSKQVSVSEAKKWLSELLGRVAYARETITIVKRGRPMARLVPVPAAASRSLASVRGWLDDDHPFFKNIEEIVAERQKRRPRRPPRLG